MVNSSETNPLPLAKPPSPASPATHLNTVCIPEFVSDAVIDDDVDLERLIKELQSKSWLPRGLTEELQQCFPAQSDTDKENNSNVTKQQ